jgi:hypothetical protein
MVALIGCQASKALRLTTSQNPQEQTLYR